MSRQIEIDPANPIQVVAGILCNAAGQVLITGRTEARSMRHHWEFPGGKVEADEESGDALCRELKEELGIVVRNFAPLQTVAHTYPDMSVVIEFFSVTGWDLVPAGREGQQLRWVDKSKLTQQPMLPADAPVIDTICRKL